MLATGGIVSPGKPHVIGDEGSPCPPFPEHAIDAGMLTPQPFFFEVEASDEEVAAVVEMLRKAMYKERE